jgi:hypothetical protein
MSAAPYVDQSGANPFTVCRPNSGKRLRRNPAARGPSCARDLRPADLEPTTPMGCRLLRERNAQLRLPE